MREWLTIAQLERLALPGLPPSARGLRALAEREAWHEQRGDDGTALVHQREGRGAIPEYHVSLLPAVARARLAAREGREKPVEEVARDLAQMQTRDVQRRDARLFVLARADDFRRSHMDLNQRQADEAYAALFNSGSGDVPSWVRGLVKSLSRPSIERWRSSRCKGRLDLVAGRYSDREGARQIARMKDGEIATFIGALIVKQPFLSAQHVRGMIEGRFGADLGELPSARSFRRFIAWWKTENSVALLKLTDPDGFKSTARLSGTNSNAHVRALNQLWEIDASPADVLTTDGRHSVYVGIDIWSRRMKVLVTKTPRTEATLALIRRCILDWGVPATIKTDNGSDFTSQRFVSAMNSLGIAHDTSDAFSPEQKGTVERAIGTLQRGLMTVLPGFVGHSVADRKVIEQRKAFSQRLGESEEQAFRVEISAAELQTYCDAWADETYAHAPHAGLDGATPFARAASWMGGIARIENDRALDLLLMPVGWRTATKQGIQIDRAYFISPYVMPGTRYLCRQDPEDMGLLYVFESEAGAYITTAVCPERAGIDPRAAVAAAREKQAEIIAESTRDIRSAARKIKPRDMVDWLQAGSRRKAANIAAFPHRSTQHVSEALTAAAEATGGPQPETPVAVPASTGNVHRLPDSPTQVFRRAMRLEACIAAGDPVSTEDAMWLGSYKQTSAYRSHMQMLEDFGPDAVLEKNGA